LQHRVNPNRENPIIKAAEKLRVNPNINAAFIQSILRAFLGLLSCFLSLSYLALIRVKIMPYGSF
jgi:hypothetical protein